MARLPRWTMTYSSHHLVRAVNPFDDTAQSSVCIPPLEGKCPICHVGPGDLPSRWFFEARARRDSEQPRRSDAQGCAKTGDLRSGGSAAGCSTIAPPHGVIENMAAEQLSEFCSAAALCAHTMLDNGAYIQKELGSIDVSDRLRGAISDVCSALMATKHDVISELIELDGLGATPRLPSSKLASTGSSSG